MIDRNKTPLTHLVTQRAVFWLDRVGFKPVETEVGVAEHWVADVAGVCTPTTTELIELRLLKSSPKFPREKSGRDWQLPPTPEHEARVAAWQVKQAAWEAARDALPKLLTASVEVKTSVNDFKRDDKWERPWPTNLCYLAMPTGLIPQDRWPKGWGIILTSADGQRLLRVFPGELRESPTERQRDVVLALAVRRDHATRYQRMRDVQKKLRIDQNEGKSLTRMTDAIRFVMAVAGGMEIEDARLRCLRQREIFLPDSVLRELAAMRGVAAARLPTGS